MRILVVDDHALVRQGLRRLLAPEGEHAITEAATGHEALALAEHVRPHVIVLDLNLPGLGGLELLKRLVHAGHGRVLVLSVRDEPQLVRRALAAGAEGYITKSAPPDEVITAVRRVSQGARYVEAHLAQALALDEPAASSTLEALTPRELEILRLLATGLSLEQIGAELGVTYKTVANNCATIKSKLGVSRTIDLLRLAIDAREMSDRRASGALNG
jgi:two-component system invasion response regulator UvrY